MIANSFQILFLMLSVPIKQSEASDNTWDIKKKKKKELLRKKTEIIPTERNEPGLESNQKVPLCGKG